jgi:hypothetical protein
MVPLRLQHLMNISIFTDRSEKTESNVIFNTAKAAEVILAVLS